MRQQAKIQAVWFLVAILAVAITPNLAEGVVPPDSASSNNQKKSTLQSPIPASTAAHSSGQSAAKYAPGQIIVKYKDSVTECAHCAFALNHAAYSITTDRSDSLDKLYKKYGVKQVRPVFRPVESEKALPKTLGAVTASTLKQISLGATMNAGGAAQAASKQSAAELQEVYVLNLGTGADVDQAVADFSSDPHVEYAQPNYLMQALFTPNDTYADPDQDGKWSQNSWGQGYEDLWGLQKIHAPEAWDVTQGQGIVVAVVDTGVDYTHPDIASNIWVNPCEDINHNGQVDASDFNGIDDACPGQQLSGYVDDIRGWDATTCQVFDNAGCAVSKSADNDPQDGFGHGTHVAGTIAAVGNNGIGVIGVAPKAKIMPIKGLNDQGSGLSSDLAAGIVYAVQQGAKVINNSWGCQCEDPVTEAAIHAAVAAGVVVVDAAGNSSADVSGFSPARIPEAITVAASDYYGYPTSFSNKGALVDVSAPGGGTKNWESSIRNILSLKSATCSPDMCPDYIVVGSDKRYLRQAGTSMAAPHVAGVVALVLSRHPDFTPQEVESVLHNTAYDLMPEGFDEATGYGRVEALAAVNENFPCVASIDTPSSASYVSSEAGSIAVRGTAKCRGTTASYVLELGTGSSPTSWVTIKADNFPVVSGVLGVWPLGNNESGAFTLRLRLLPQGTSREYKALSSVYVFPGQHHGWPKQLLGSSAGAAFGDLDGDGLDEVILVGGAGIVAYRHDGSIPPGWPVDVPAVMAPAVGDIDGDGRAEVVVSTPTEIYAYHGDGTIVSGWPQPAGQLSPSPLLVDIDKDGKKEVVTATTEYQLYVRSGDGKILPGWPQALPNLISSPDIFLAAADMNLDGMPEIVVGLTNSNIDGKSAVVVFNAQGSKLPGWPVFLPIGEDLRNIALGDLSGDGRPEILFYTIRVLVDPGPGNPPGTYSKRVWALTPNGQSLAGWPRSVDALFYGEPLFVIGGPAVADLDRDGKAEVIITSGFGGLAAVLGANGAVLPGWPVSTSSFTGSPVIADVDGEGHPDIVCVSFDAIRAFDRSGKLLPGWPQYLPKSFGVFVGEPNIVDLDKNGTLELFAGGGSFIGGPLLLYDLPAPFDLRTLQWPQPKHDSALTSAYRMNPDLLVASLTAPALGGSGGTVALNYGLQNAASGPAFKVGVSFHLSKDNAYGGNDDVELSMSSLAHLLEVSLLAPKVTKTGSVSVMIPNSAALGAYYVCAKMDPEDAVFEENETNNSRCSAATIKIVQADLAVTQVTVSKTIIKPGDWLVMTDTVKNQGTISSDSVISLSSVISKNSIVGDGDDLVKVPYRQILTPIPVGGTNTGSGPVYIPETLQPGTYSFCAFVEESMKDLDNTNNARCVAIEVMLPDLQMYYLESVGPAKPGGVLAVREAVQNIGKLPSAAVVLQYRLSEDTVVGDADDRLLQTRFIPVLAVGTNSPVTLNVSIPENVPTGKYFVCATVDSTNVMQELSETNNTLCTPTTIDITLPDLIILSVTTTATGVPAGGSFTATDTVKNKGPVAGASKVAYRLSSDAVYGGADDVLLSAVRNVPELAALTGGSMGSVSLSIPAATPAGAYHVCAEADATRVVPEYAETNNTQCSTTQIQVLKPDLIPLQVGTTATIVRPGGSLTLTDTLQNIGTAASGSSVIQYALSLSSTGSLIPLTGSRTVTSLGAQAKNTGTANVAAYVPDGIYVVCAVVDAFDQVSELNETNNRVCSQSTLRISSLPDFTVTQVSVPASLVRPGATLTVSDSVKNAGAVASGAFTVGYLLSHDAVIGNTDDVWLVGGRSIASLGATAVTSATATAILPINTPLGLSVMRRC